MPDSKNDPKPDAPAFSSPYLEGSHVPGMDTIHALHRAPPASGFSVTSRWYTAFVVCMAHPEPIVYCQVWRTIPSILSPETSIIPYLEEQSLDEGILTHSKCGDGSVPGEKVTFCYPWAPGP